MADTPVTSTPTADAPPNVSMPASTIPDLGQAKPAMPTLAPPAVSSAASGNVPQRDDHQVSRIARTRCLFSGCAVLLLIRYADPVSCLFTHRRQGFGSLATAS